MYKKPAILFQNSRNFNPNFELGLFIKSINANLIMQRYYVFGSPHHSITKKCTFFIPKVGHICNTSLPYPIRRSFLLLSFTLSYPLIPYVPILSPFLFSL